MANRRNSILDNFDIEAYAARLYERRSEGIITGVAEASNDDWTPSKNECHANVTDWCEHYLGHKPVRGWLYFDFDNLLPIVRFNAHSVIENENGELFDITPSKASQRYPFIRAEESEEEFAFLVEELNTTIINYSVKR